MWIKNRKHKKVPLRRYWTTRYLLTLVIGLLVIALVSALWIRHTTLETRLNLMEVIAEETADRYADLLDGTFIPGGRLPGLERERFMNFEIDPVMYIVDAEGNILSSNRPLPRPLTDLQLDHSIIDSEQEVEKFTLDEELRDYYFVKKPIMSSADADTAATDTETSEPTGWVVMVETEDNLTKVNQEYRQLAVMILSLALLGWGAIYFLSKRLASPIKDVSHAAKQVQNGDYNIQLSEDVKEEELHDLILSFKEMSSRLQQLEALRTELLAGVTHELKTPVTSISGLLQAVNDDVVTGEEAKEFLRISLKETMKMKLMVEDLLSFNSFAAHAVPLQLENQPINQLIEDLVYQWKVTQEKSQIDTSVVPLDQEEFAVVDPIRFNQIMTNLLNNAKQSIEAKGKIDINIQQTGDYLAIKVSDTGSGIPEDEQSLIFERFFRGKEKKFKFGGLGLGLSLSKMIAQSMGGDLKLLKSSPEGTTFIVTLQKQK